MLFRRATRVGLALPFLAVVLGAVACGGGEGEEETRQPFEAPKALTSDAGTQDPATEAEEVKAAPEATLPEAPAEGQDCVSDEKEPNNGSTSSAELGAFTDQPESKMSLSKLSLADGDEDWFTLDVSDTGFDGNPDVKVEAPGLEITIYYVCKDGKSTPSCPKGTPVTDGPGKGCRGVGVAQAKASCSGISEDGTAKVRIQKVKADAKCQTYTAKFNVD